MRIIAIITMLMSGLLADQATAENVWKPPALTDCSTESGSRGEKDCKRMNYCVSSSTEACYAHVGNIGEDQGRSGLLNGCWDNKMMQCLQAVEQSDTASTNVTNSPDAWDCIFNPGKPTQRKADPSDCRRVNFCLGSASTTCSEKIGAAKYTPEGQYKMAGCVQEKEIACMRTVD